MMIIGLTGPTGGGKSTVAAMLRDIGFTVIDCDKVAREVTEKGSPLLDTLRDVFGEDIMTSDGSLDRKALAAKAFCDAESTEKLNSVMLPFIADRIKEMTELYAADGNDRLLLDAPTLFESGLDSICDSVVAVLCPKDIRKKRIIARDGLTEAQADIRLKASKPDDFYKQKTPHIVVNSGELEEFRSAVLSVIGEILK